MKVEYAKYMRYGKRVKVGEDVFFLVSGVDLNSFTAKAVADEHKNRYDLLKAWSRNRVGLTEDQKAEMIGYEKELSIKEFEPDNDIRFITPHYDLKFRIKDLSPVLCNGKERMAVYHDEYHFSFVDGGVWHICEFAEACERNDITVRPVVA